LLELEQFPGEAGQFQLGEERLFSWRPTDELGAKEIMKSCADDGFGILN
jgi:hypothetical protein